MSCTPSEPEVSLVVSFDNRGKGQAPASQTMLINTKAVRPADPFYLRYKFTGWYTDENCTSDADRMRTYLFFK